MLIAAYFEIVTGICSRISPIAEGVIFDCLRLKHAVVNLLYISAGL